MAVDILAVVAAQRLQAIRKSVTGSENHEKRVSNTAAKAAAVLTGSTVGNHAVHLEEYMLRDMYVRVLEEYNRKPNYAYFGQEFTPQGLALWKRAVKALKASGVSRETFVRAQFTWFHEKFRKAPTTLQLTTDEAVLRAASVEVDPTVRSNDTEAKISVGDLFRCCEKQMNAYMRAQGMTREEVYRKLVIPGVAVFPGKFLAADPVWAKVKDK